MAALKPAGPPLAVSWRDTALVIAGALVALLLRNHDSFRMPFINDDYMFLDATRGRSALSVWGLTGLAFHWWRPWSRELHYLVMQRLAGTNVFAYHAVNMALLVCALTAYFRLAAGMVGCARAAFATAAVAALSGLAEPLLWVAGVQELWMFLWSLLALLAWRSGRTAAGTVAFALALMSKETAATLPALFVAMDLTLGRRTVAASLRRVAPALGLELLWAIVHPRLGGQLLHPHPAEQDIVAGAPHLFDRLLRTLLSNVSMDRFPAPNGDYGPWWAWTAASALVLALVVWRLTRPHGSGPAAEEPPRTNALGLAVAWTVFGWLPLLLPGLGWQAYYAAWGSFGAWLAIAAFVPWDRPAVVAIVAALACLGGARDATPSREWGDAYYQRRAGNLLLQVKALVQQVIVSPAPHTRLYFWQMPDRIGFLNGDGPALRVWFADPTLRGGLLSSWRPRAAGDTGVDRFFRLDGDQLGEVHAGPEDVQRAILADPDWVSRHNDLAITFANGRDPLAAAREYEKLARAQPRDAESAYDAATFLLDAGDTTAGMRWMDEMKRRPLVTDRLRAALRASGVAAR